jgi:hypothetical protein
MRMAVILWMTVEQLEPLPVLWTRLFSGLGATTAPGLVDRWLKS